VVHFSKVKKLNIFLYHLAVFILGSLALVAYVFIHLATPESGAGVAGVIVMPVIALVYVVAFGILCLISLAAFLLIAYLRRPHH
jgi:hypothetical protein